MWPAVDPSLVQDLRAAYRHHLRDTTNLVNKDVDIVPSSAVPVLVQNLRHVYHASGHVVPQHGGIVESEWSNGSSESLKSMGSLQHESCLGTEDVQASLGLTAGPAWHVPHGVQLGHAMDFADLQEGLSGPHTQPLPVTGSTRSPSKGRVKHRSPTRYAVIHQYFFAGLQLSATIAVSCYNIQG